MHGAQTYLGSHFNITLFCWSTLKNKNKTKTLRGNVSSLHSSPSLQLKPSVISVLVWTVHSIIHNKTTNKSFNYIKNINIHLEIKLYFSYIYCNVIALISLKKKTHLMSMSEECFLFLVFLCYVITA